MSSTPLEDTRVRRLGGGWSVEVKGREGETIARMKRHGGFAGYGAPRAQKEALVSARRGFLDFSANICEVSCRQSRDGAHPSWLDLPSSSPTKATMLEICTSHACQAGC